MKNFVFLTLFVSLASGQEISCNYTLNNVIYVCNLFINNPTGFDCFTDIAGVHLSGFTDDDVASVTTIAPTASTNFPQIVCQKFRSLQAVEILSGVTPAILQLTESSFRHCAILEAAILSVPVLSIHPQTFASNPRLDMVVIPGNHALTTLPAELFVFNPLLRSFQLMDVTNLQTLPSRLLYNQRNLETLFITGSHSLSWNFPRDFLSSSNSLRSIGLTQTGIQQVDFFSLNNVNRLEVLNLRSSPINAIDFNIIERAQNLRSFDGHGMSCGTLWTNNFQLNREENLAALETCFMNFDRRVLRFATPNLVTTFNSIRQQSIFLQVINTPSDVVVTFSNSPDGSGSNFQIRFGTAGNTRTELFETGILRATFDTPGILGSGWTGFSVSWRNGLLEVWNPNLSFEHQLSENFPVRFLGVSTWASGAFPTWDIMQDTWGKKRKAKNSKI